MDGDSEYVLEPLRREADFIFYRGMERGNQIPILAVAVATEHPLPQCLRRLENEYSLATALDPAWAAQPVALTRHQGRALLILKHPGGEPLDRVIERQNGKPIDLTRFLRVAIGLAAALKQTHQQGLIHKDIKPANVLVDDAGQVWLTGFGIASRLPRERQTLVPPEIIAGTLAYMSPEQTGRMNRSIDSRSDLYSLGITLYQMLTGALPFAAADFLEWVHCHIARQPEAPIDRREAPEQLSAIIMRLLAKTAEERYQTAAGLEADLRRCLSEWQSHHRIESFALGADDYSGRLLIPETLYGREHEVDALNTAFDRVVAHGTSELVLVSGYSGVGKSSIVSELHRVMIPPRGLFAAGKFDQYMRDVPYATLAQAFQMLVRQILIKSETEVKRWRRDLLEALGPNGQLMINLIPELEFITGKQPPVAELPPHEARGRFQLVFRRFLGVFARPDHPLVLFLDDLQWLDTATLEFLESLVTDAAVRHVLLIGAYRDNEVSSSHPLMRTLAVAREAGAKTQEIVLAPLGCDEVQRLITDALHCEPNAANHLAHVVHEKSGGNPFFAIQFLTALVEEGLLWSDRTAAGWRWDLDRIRTQGYTSNVVDLMVSKLHRLPRPTQTALQQLACLGNVVETATLSRISGQSEEDIRTALLEAVHAGLIQCVEDSYTFLHDRIHEAAYALIPESERTGAHLRIGRMLLASLTADDLTEQLFLVANQFDRGASLLVDHEEKVRAAAIHLAAGRKAKASAAYSSAGMYFASGRGLLSEADWSNRYELTFSLWLESAECEFLTAHFSEADQLIFGLLQHAVSNVDQAAVECLKIRLHVLKSDYVQAVETGLSFLGQLGIDIPAHPTEERLQPEYEALWHALGERDIESLIDLPLMTDTALQITTQVLAALLPPSFITDFRLGRLLTCRVVKIGLLHGTSSAFAVACSTLGMKILAPVFRRYNEAYRIAKLGADLAEKHGFISSKSRVYGNLSALAIWTQPIANANAFNRAVIRASLETGDQTIACYQQWMSLGHRFLRNDPLDEVESEAAMALDFVRRAKFDDPANIIAIQRWFIATMQGRAAVFYAIGDTQIDEASFVDKIARAKNPVVIGWYWILKLKARFLSGDYAAALAAVDMAKRVRDAAAGQSQEFEYYYYAALTVSELYETGSPSEQQAWHELLRVHLDQLREWANNCPPTFGDKYALVSAEIARLEGRDIDALSLYEQAIHLARDNGFVQNEGLAHERAARYCLARGLETAGYAHLGYARNCYDRWGAHGKVKQLDDQYPRLHKELPFTSSATIGSSVGQLDVETVVKVSQALSSEMILSELIEKLVRIAMEHAGASRCLLVLLRGGANGVEPRIEAEANTGPGGVEVVVRQAAIRPSDLPKSVLNYVIRTQEAVLLDNASAESVHSTDAYVQQNRTKSVLCLPIVRQGKLVGALYLENDLALGVFTPARTTVLDLLVSQAAISLENAVLYADLQRSKEYLDEGQRLAKIGSYSWFLDTDEPLFSDEARRILGFDNRAPVKLRQFWDVIHPDDIPLVTERMEAALAGRDNDYVFRARMQDGSIRYLRNCTHEVRIRNGRQELVGLVLDITESRLTEEALTRARNDLAHVARVATLNAMTASIAHEVSQPLSGILMNANTTVRMLAADPPNLVGAADTARRTIRDANRASEVIERLRSLFSKKASTVEIVDLNDAAREVIALSASELQRKRAHIQTDFADDLPFVSADRVQLQQVILNLLLNAADAMAEVEDRPRTILVKTGIYDDGSIELAVRDSGTGVDPLAIEKLFEAFYTTKADGMGVGLSVCRSIIQTHNGRLWGDANAGHGATFTFCIPGAKVP